MNLNSRLKPKINIFENQKSVVLNSVLKRKPLTEIKIKEFSKQ